MCEPVKGKGEQWYTILGERFKRAQPYLSKGRRHGGALYRKPGACDDYEARKRGIARSLLLGGGKQSRAQLRKPGERAGAIAGRLNYKSRRNREDRRKRQIPGGNRHQVFKNLEQKHSGGGKARGKK